MLKRNKRIQGRTRVPQILKEGESQGSSFLVVRRLPGEFKWSRFSVVVSKKAAKLAVNRNKARRQLYEILRDLEKDPVPNTIPFDTVFVVRSGFLPFDFNRKREEVLKLLSRYQ